MERLWAPWRMRYVGGEARSGDAACIFCAKPAAPDPVENLILHRGEHAFLIMNLYPYNTGHVMAVPHVHVADLDQLSAEQLAGLTGLLPWITAAQRRVLNCDGLNLGLNIGAVAGAGVADHLHIHIVPRWEGDANFMPIVANTMVLPELIPVTYAKLRAELELSGLGKAPNDPATPQAGAVVLLPSLGKVALRRARDGMIVFPKGHIEAGEPAWRAALREVHEEMGLRAEIVGWAGTLRYLAGGRERLVAHLVVQAEPTPEFDEHLGVDALLFDPVEAIAALPQAAARDLLRAALRRTGFWAESAG